MGEIVGQGEHVCLDRHAGHCLYGACSGRIGAEGGEGIL